MPSNNNQTHREEDLKMNKKASGISKPNRKNTINIDCSNINHIEIANSSLNRIQDPQALSIQTTSERNISEGEILSIIDNAKKLHEENIKQLDSSQLKGILKTFQIIDERDLNDMRSLGFAGRSLLSPPGWDFFCLHVRTIEVLKIIIDNLVKPDLLPIAKDNDEKRDSIRRGRAGC